MSTSIRNRNDSYVAVIEKLPEKKQLIFQLIKENSPCTAWEISEKYLLPINEVVGRISDLKNECLLIEKGSRLNRYTNKQNTLYKAVNSFDERIDLVNARFTILRDTKDKLVNDYNLGLSKLTKELIKKQLNKINKQINSLTKILDNGNKV